MTPACILIGMQHRMHFLYLQQLDRWRNGWVGRSIFVNVMYEYHYKIMNLINSISRFPPCPRVNHQLWLAKPLVILAPHSSLYFCTDPHCQTAGLPSPTIILHARHQAAMAYVDSNCACTLSKPHPLIYIYESMANY